MLEIGELGLTVVAFAAMLPEAGVVKGPPDPNPLKGTERDSPVLVLELATTLEVDAAMAEPAPKTKSIKISCRRVG